MQRQASNHAQQRTHSRGTPGTAGVRRSRAAGHLVTENYRQYAKDSGIELVPANMVASKVGHRCLRMGVDSCSEPRLSHVA